MEDTIKYLGADKAAAIYGTAETDWVPDRETVIEALGAENWDAHNTATLVAIFVLIGRNREPDNFEDRIRAGLENRFPADPDDAAPVAESVQETAPDPDKEALLDKLERMAGCAEYADVLREAEVNA